MPKRVFWPLALLMMGLIFFASNVGLLPRDFWNLWPIILIVVGLGGLLISDKEEWDGQPKIKKAAPKVASAPAAKKGAKKATKRR